MKRKPAKPEYSDVALIFEAMNSLAATPAFKKAFAEIVVAGVGAQDPKLIEPIYSMLVATKGAEFFDEATGFF